ncbi:hypothetical protein ACFVFJ_49690 [Streptomyces sp. NPDC057717]|uniref:hypothetical protein n=1 Tax=Streptomyces sp. NPDC057717 TaxID=3346224 RepID=UPI0036ACAA7E
MAIHPGMVEDLAAGTHDLYGQAEQPLLADELDASIWVEWKLSAVQAVRRASQDVVDGLGKADADAILAETGAGAPDPAGSLPLG